MSPFIDTSLRVHRLTVGPKQLRECWRRFRLNCSKILRFHKLRPRSVARVAGKQGTSAVMAGYENSAFNWDYFGLTSSSKYSLSNPQVSGSNPEGRTRVCVCVVPGEPRHFLLG